MQLYDMPWLGSLGKLVWIAAPIYWIVEFTTTSSYYSPVDTAAFFSTSCSTGYVYVNDTVLADGYIPLNYSQLVLQNGEDWLFLTTKFTIEIQNLTTNAEKPGYYEWETVKEANVYIPMDNLTLLDLKIISRIECDYKIFSNYDRNDPSTNKFYELSVDRLLSMAGVSKCGGISNSSSPYLNCCETSCPYAGYTYNKGLDVAVVYDWDCDLTVYDEDSRYLCAYDNLEVDAFKISSSSIVDKVMYSDFIYDGITSNSKYRQKLSLLGIKIRFRAIGGCARPSLEGVTNVLAQGYVIHKIFTVIMTSLVAYTIYWTGRDLLIRDEVTGEWEMRTFVPQTGLGPPKVQEKNTVEMTDTSTRNVLNADGGKQN